jgi:hypothetical protein
MSFFKRLLLLSAVACLFIGQVGLGLSQWYCLCEKACQHSCCDAKGSDDNCKSDNKKCADVVDYQWVKLGTPFIALEQEEKTEIQFIVFDGFIPNFLKVFESEQDNKYYLIRPTDFSDPPPISGKKKRVRMSSFLC